MKTLTAFLNESRTTHREEYRSPSDVVMYGTKFELTNPVNDFAAAKEYLVEDDMTEYLKEHLQRKHPELAAKVFHIEWNLMDDDAGWIYLDTTEKLNNRELDIISDWVSGQCSDGLGEGFEQQPFACYPDKNSDYDEYIVASFDWKTNKYKFRYCN